MLDFGFSELLLIAALALFVIGPKEIPALMTGLGRIVRRLQYVRYAFSQQFEDFMRESDLEELRRAVNFEERAVTTEETYEAQDDALHHAPPVKKKPTAKKKAKTKKKKTASKSKKGSRT